jgi:hypothetical protein
MSPVSRGRKPKKAKKGKKPPAHVTNSGWAKAARREFGGLSLGVPHSPLEEFFESLDRRPPWWEPSFERLTAASVGLLTAQGPQALEQATAELIGAELYQAVCDEQTGLRFDMWAMELIGYAMNWMVDAAGRGDAAWRGPWWLLHGLAAIGSYGLGGFAWEQASEAAGSLPRDLLAAEPAWLKLLPDIKATGDVRAMRDAYGTRFGVIASFCYPGGVDPSVYLLDVDACGSTVLAGAGVFDDMESAAVAWRDRVGVSAEGLIPVPATAESLACLVYCEHEEAFISGHESRTQKDNFFRGPRRISDIYHALHQHGVVLPKYSPRYHHIDVAPMADPFTRWYAERHGHEPDQEAVEALAGVWLEGMLPGTEHAVSPHRTEYFRGIISDWQDDPVTGAALALLPEWVRWNGEQAGVPAPLIERAVSERTTIPASSPLKSPTAARTPPTAPGNTR